MSFKEIKPEELNFNPFTRIGSDWMLLTAGTEDKFNTMTASWGGAGVFWGKPAVTCYIRPQRYTKEFVDNADTFSLCFFGGEKMQELGYLGTVSGRDEDKIAKSGLTLTHIDGVPCFEEATTVLLCRKMYVQTLREDCFTDRAVMESSYPQRDFHDLYVAEIMKVLVK